MGDDSRFSLQSRVVLGVGFGVGVQVLPLDQVHRGRLFVCMVWAMIAATRRGVSPGVLIPVARGRIDGVLVIWVE